MPRFRMLKEDVKKSSTRQTGSFIMYCELSGICSKSISIKFKEETWHVMFLDAGAHSFRMRSSREFRSVLGGTLMSNPASASEGCRFIINPYVQKKNQKKKLVPFKESKQRHIHEIKRNVIFLSFVFTTKLGL